MFQFLCLLDFVFFNPLCNRQSVISRSSAWMPSSHPPPILSIHVYTDPEDQMKRSFILDPVCTLRNGETLINVIFTSNPAITVDSGIVKTRISDHYLVFAVLNLRMPKPQAIYVVTRSYKHYDPQSFLSDLNKIPRYENILSDDVDEKLPHFNKAFYRVLDNHAPIKKIKIKHRRCPFINEEIKEKMPKRDQAHRIARETVALVHWQYYRDCRNDVKRVLREAEKKYVQNEVKNNQSSSERWKVIRNCIPTREKSRPAYYRDMKELATEFNEFFTEVGVRASEEAIRLASVNGLPTSHQKLPVSFIPEENEFQFRAATSFEVNRIV